MNNCTKCGKETADTDKFCPHCGAPIVQTAKDGTIKANVKVELTNATTEKAFKAAGDVISSGKRAVTTGAKAATGLAKKIAIPVIILAIIGGISAYMYDQKQSDDRTKAWLESDEIRNSRSIDNVLGNHKINAMTMNSRFVSYNKYTKSIEYSDEWPYPEWDDDYGYWKSGNDRPNGKVSITKEKITITLDKNRDNRFSSDETRVFLIKNFDTSKKYRVGGYMDIFGYDSILRFNFRGYDDNRLSYETGNDSYQLWLD